MTTLRDYQARALAAVNASPSARVVCVVPTGGGKSVIGREWVRGHVDAGRRVLMVAHRIELLTQFAAHAARAGVRGSVLAPGHIWDPTAPLTCASVDTINARGAVPQADAILWDECFPAGTLVDGKPIEKIQVGDKVSAVNHTTGMVQLRRVVRSMSKIAKKLYRLTCGATELTCTGNHPIFVKGRGYVEAKDLKAGDLLCLWNGVPVRNGHWTKAMVDMLEGVSCPALVGDYDAHQQGSRFWEDEEEEPDGVPANSRQSLEETPGDRSRTEISRRQRARANACGESDCGGSWLENERCSSDVHHQGHRDPYELQTGRSESGAESCHRSRRAEPLFAVQEDAGPEKGGLVTWSRLDCVARVEPSSLGGDRVYNLEVEGSHTYFANGVLVHNCHHAVAETYAPILAALPTARVLGLTATPQRGDGKPLGDLFDDLVIGAQYSELLKAGHLVPCRVLRPEEHLGSDFARDPVEAWLEHAGTRQGFVFARSVEASRDIAKRLTAAGVPAANVDGGLTQRTREGRLEAFRRGEIRVLTNVHVLTEGVDIPQAEVCMLARSPNAAGTYLQMVGRVLRPAPGKTTAMLIDLPGASHVHGIPTADREYSLTGRSIKTTGESLRVCPECGNTQPSALRECESCGFRWPRKEYQGPKIWNVALVEYIESMGDGTAASLATAPKDLKRAEWDRLLEVGERRGFGRAWAVKEWRALFADVEPPKEWIKEIGEADRVKELQRLLGIQRGRGLKPGWISHAYKQTFGAFPSRALREAAGVPVPSQDGWG